MSEPIYSVDHFLAKFSAIPEDRWCEGSVGEPGGQRCALGHCNYSYGPIEYAPLEAQALMRIFPVEDDTDAGETTVVTAINDNRDPLYPQLTPKLRILAALEDVKRKKAVS